ncbi:MAG: DUF4350 domain-containing protein [Polyangiaceae bacterium]|nr:DUF4350 domain-containing protein [Polyangiaceae bacterium]
MTQRRTRRAFCADLLRTTKRTGLLVASSAVGLGAALAPRSASAAVFDISDSEWEGLSEFYQIAKTELGPDRVKPVATLDWSELRPEDGIVFIHPTEPIDSTEASEFMKQGGRLAVVDDFGRGDELLKRFRIERIRMPGRPVTALRQDPELPIAEPWLEISRGQIGAPHPVVSSVKRLVLNHPMALVHPDLSPVLKVRLAKSEGDAIVAVAGQVEKGRLFAMSDPSALINSMLRYPGNRAFAVGLVKYLANDADRQNGRLYIVTNAYKQEGSVGGDRTMLQEVEGALRSLGDSLADVRKTGFPSWLLAILAAGGIALLAVWVGRTSGRPYRSPLPRYARSTPLVARGGVAGRFAMLAAPSSPKGLVLLELKSALFDAMSERFGLEPNPSSDAVVKAVRRSGLVDDSLQSHLARVMQKMQTVESALTSGSGARVPRAVVEDAHHVVRAVIAAVGALEPARAVGRSYGGGDVQPPSEREPKGPADGTPADGAGAP